ncbi:MAG: glycosyltransferase family 2 protein, partial [Bacteroidota bacterium]
MKKVAVVILNWNGAKFLRKFLPSVLKHSTEAEIVVADNASADDSLVILEKEFPQVRIIKNHRNEGFAKGYNTALKQIDADYYVLLNSDVEVTANWIQPVIELLERDNSIGAVQPKIRSWYEPEKFEYAGAAGGFLDLYGYPFCRGRIFEHTEKDLQQYDDSREIFWATGACMFVRADLFHDSGGFDPDFFAHMEEIDFCWRIKQKGYKVMFTPKSLVYHVGGGTLPSSSSFKTYLNIRNNLAMLYKNLPQENLSRTIFVRLLLDGIAAIKFLFSGGFPEM